MHFVFSDDFQNAGAADIHLVERLHGREARRAALVGLLQRLIRGGVRHCSEPNFFFSSIMVSAARAAKPPLSPSDRRARAQA
ncbi:hypothetical protein D3C78_1874490 [compost metagenome]